MYKEKISALCQINMRLADLYREVNGEEFITMPPISMTMFPEECLCETDVISMYEFVLHNMEYGCVWIADAAFDSEFEEKSFRDRLFTLKSDMSKIMEGVRK